MQITTPKICSRVRSRFSRRQRGLTHRFALGWPLLLVAVLLTQLTACVGPLREHVLYEHGDIRIGLQTDLSTQRASPPTTNAHPRQISSQDMRTLLGAVEVSGWSGILFGLFQEPRPLPVFTMDELDVIAAPIAQAFQQAGPQERVFFSIPDAQKPYPSEKDKTAGALFFRGQYLHMVLTDHYAFTRADPGGGEDRDPRDTKGMKLWAASPARAAVVPQEQEPAWTAFEKIHLSLVPKDVLIARGSAPAPAMVQMPKATAAPTSSQVEAEPPKSVETEQRKERDTSASEDLRLQLKELTNSNVDLRSRLKEQSEEIQAMREELERLRKQIKPRASQKPSPKTSPAPLSP